MDTACKLDTDLFETLTRRQPLPPLHPKKVWREELRGVIEALSAPPLIKGVLHLLNDDLDSAHAVAQAAGTPDGNYLHALVHRREGDFSNSRYWLRTLREHPAWQAMRRAEPGWDPLKFLAWCESCAEGCPKNPCDKLEGLQLREMVAFLETLG